MSNFIKKWIFTFMLIIFSSLVMCSSVVMAFNQAPNQELSPDSILWRDEFASSIFYHNSNVIIGSPGEIIGSVSSGAAYIFERNGNGNYVKKVKLVEVDAQDYSRYGNKVLLSDDFAFVSSPGYRVGSVRTRGVVFIYKKNALGEWVNFQELIPTEYPQFKGIDFGHNMALSNNTLIVGGYTYYGMTYIASVYIYTFDGTQWNEELILKSPVNGVDFGFTGVAIEGDKMAVAGKRLGEYLPQYGTNEKIPEVYVYDKSSGDWTLEATLTPSTPELSMRYGHEIIINGDIIVVTDRDEKRSLQQNQRDGAAYIYENNNGQWLETKKIRESSSFSFGKSVALQNNNLLIGGGWYARHYKRDISGDWQKVFESLDANSGVTFTETGGIFGAYHSTSASLPVYRRARSAKVFDLDLSKLNSAPVITEVSPHLIVTFDGVEKNFSLNALDAENDVLTWSIQNQANNGIVTLIGDSNFSYAPNSNAVGNDSFIIKVTDTLGLEDTVVVNAANNRTTNNAPIITEGETHLITTTNGGAVTFWFHGTDTDTDDVLTWKIQSQGQYGSVMQWSTSSFMYAPNSAAPGNDSFNIMVTDVLGATDSITVNVVNSRTTNSAPVIEEGDIHSITTTNGNGVIFILHGNDPENDALIWSVLSQGQYGVVEHWGVSGFLYIPDNDDFDDDNIVIQLTDLLGATDVITINVNNNRPLINTAPEISEGISVTHMTLENISVNFTLNAVDEEGDSLTWGYNTAPTHGTISNFETGTQIILTYTPNIDFVGTDTFIIHVSDGNLTDIIGVNITIMNNSSNAAPTITGLPATAVEVNAEYSFTPESSDINGDTLMFSIVNLPNWATFNASTGALTGTPEINDLGLTSNIEISVFDGVVSTLLSPFSILVEDATSTDDTLPIIKSNQIIYIHTDLLGTPVVESDVTGSVN